MHKEVRRKMSEDKKGNFQEEECLARNARHDYAQRGRQSARERRVCRIMERVARNFLRVSRLFSLVFDTRTFTSFDRNNSCFPKDDDLDAEKCPIRQTIELRYGI